MTKINFLDCLRLFFNKNTSQGNTTCNSWVLCIQGSFSQQLTYRVHTEQAVLGLAFNPPARYSRGNVVGEGTRFLKMNLLSDKDLMENQNKTSQ